MTAIITADYASPTFQAHAVCPFGTFGTSPLSPPAEFHAVDITDLAVRRLNVTASLIATALAVAGLALAYTAG